MAKQETDYKINIDTKGADKNVDNLTDSLEANEKQIKETEKAAGNLSKGFDKTASGSDKAGKSSVGLGSKLKALSANPIVLILGALVAIFKGMEATVKRNGKAAVSFDKVWSQIDGTFNALWETLDPIISLFFEKVDGFFSDPIKTIRNFGNSIKSYVTDKLSGLAVIWGGVKDIFAGDFEEGWEKIKAGGQEFKQDMIDVSDEVSDAWDGATKALSEFGDKFAENRIKQIAASKELEANKSRIIEMEADLTRALIDSKLEQELLKQQRKDASLDIEKRIDANNRIAETLEIQAQKERDIIAAKLHFNELEMIRQGMTDELYARQLELENQLADVEVRKLKRTTEQLKFNQTLHTEKDNQIKAETKAINDQIALDKKAANNKIALNKKVTDEKAAQKKKDDVADKAQAKLEKDIRKQQLGASLGALDTIAQAIDEDGLLSKGVAAVQSGINTVEGATKAFAQGGVGGFITGGLIAAAGAVSVATILGTSIPKRSKKGGGSTPSVSVPKPPTASVPDASELASFDEIYGDGLERDGSTIKGNDKNQVKAIVVLSDINDAQNESDNIDSNSSL